MKDLDCYDLYKDPRHYDLHNKDLVADIPFILSQIEKFGDPALELACGTGRITIPIAEKGYRVTGLDISEPMLSHAKKKADENVSAKISSIVVLVFLYYPVQGASPVKEPVLNFARKRINSPIFPGRDNIGVSVEK